MTDAETALAQVNDALGKGECLKAYDLAAEALEAAPGHELLRHRKVLALARAGASAMAKIEFDRLGLADVKTEEALSLEARIEKDLALVTRGYERTAALARAASAYTDAFEAEGGYYPAINVASLRLLADDNAEAQEWAGIALNLARGGSYYEIATRAEAYLALGAPDMAAKEIAAAANAPDANPASLATTRRQLAMLVDALGLDPAVLGPLRPKAVLHYTGHIIAAPGAKGRFPADQEAEVTAAVASFFRENAVGVAVGSLAAGADIIVAEAALRANAEVHLVLPFEEDEFKAISVAPSGGDWLTRYEAVKRDARSVRFVTEEPYLGDDALFGYASQYALGYGRLRASWLDAPMLQLAIWDGEPAGHAAKAGAGYDMDLARRGGDIAQTVIPVRSTRPPPAPDAADPAQPEPKRREPRTMVFGDFKGFSKLPDSAILTYVDDILGAAARTADAHEAHIVFRNTWGDGLFIVFDDPTAVAECAFALQEAVTHAVATTVGVPKTLGLRLGMHYGPVYETEDTMLKRRNVFGAHVSRAARVEPITPEGEVYVTDETAAALLFHGRDRYAADYVGRMPLAKNYGDAAKYRLRRAD